MQDIILTDFSSGSLEEYEKLLLRRDNLRKEAEQCQIDYIREFGDLMVRSYEIKVECIKKKKMIAYCQQLVNRGEKINGAKLDAFIAKEMAEYRTELEQMIRSNKAVKAAEGISSYDLHKVKQLYRALAKLIHPDLHPALADDPEIMELWNRIVLAYEHNRLADLEELDFLVRNYLNSKGEKDLEVIVPDLGKKIAEVKAEIRRITSTDPYLYRLLLEDEDAVNDKKQELTDEIEDYTVYSKQLDEILAQFDIEYTYS